MLALKMSKKTVIAIMIAATVAIIGWDVWLYFDDVPGNTISQIVITGSESSPYVPLGLGLFIGWLIGHFYG